MNYDQVEYTKRWSNFSIGVVPWINANKEHAAKALFVDYICRSDFKTILEIGAGEANEAREIVSIRNDISYSIVDISDVFLEHCQKDERLNCRKGTMTSIPAKKKEFDIVYMHGVLEHTPNICDTILELSRVSRRFYITLFKWKMGGSGFSSVYPDLHCRSNYQ